MAPFLLFQIYISLFCYSKQSLICYEFSINGPNLMIDRQLVDLSISFLDIIQHVTI